MSTNNSILKIFEDKIGVNPGSYPSVNLLGDTAGCGATAPQQEAYQLDLIRSWLIAQGIPRDGEHGCGRSGAYTLRKAYQEPRYLNGWLRKLRGTSVNISRRGADSRTTTASAIFEQIAAVEDDDEIKEQNALEDAAETLALSTSGAIQPQDTITATAEAIGKAADAILTNRLKGFEDLITQKVKETVAGTKLELSDDTKRMLRALVTETATKVVESMTPQRIEVFDPNLGVSRDLGLQHSNFPKLLRAAQARTANGYHLNVWLTGPAGSGKTTAVENVAKALYAGKRPDPKLLAQYGLNELDIGFDFDSGPMGGDGSLDADYKVIGFKDAGGKFHWTTFLKCFVFGYVYCADEIDNWMPSALLSLNGATANGWISTPLGILRRHKDFLIVACANTWGLGATNEYVGRTRQDAASLDRFQPKIDWPIDEALEANVAREMGGLDWCKVVQEVRGKAKAQGLQVIISPRATYSGISLLASGFELSEVIDMTLAAGLKPEQRKALDIDAIANRSQWQLYADAAS